VPLDEGSDEPPRDDDGWTDLDVPGISSIVIEIDQRLDRPGGSA
jgi:hypothetical protein